MPLVLAIPGEIVLGPTGLVVDRIAFSAFGQVLRQTNPTLLNRYLFTGREFQPSVSMYYHRARSFSPWIGRFSAQDPIRLDATEPNLYRYALNNPLVFLDPTGTEAATEYAIFATMAASAVGAAVSYLVCDLWLLGKVFSWHDFRIRVAWGFVLGAFAHFLAEAEIIGKTGFTPARTGGVIGILICSGSIVFRKVWYVEV